MGSAKKTLNCIINFDVVINYFKAQKWIKLFLSLELKAKGYKKKNITSYAWYGLPCPILYESAQWIKQIHRTR